MFNLARRSVFAFAVLANFYSKSFLLGTLCNSLQLAYARNTLKSVVSAYSTIPALAAMIGFEPTTSTRQEDVLTNSWTVFNLPFCFILV